MKAMQPFPLWGPYGKKYMGLSRLVEAAHARGVRFDVTTVPAIFGGDIKIPNVTLPSGCHPWRCSPDYSLVTYRHDLEWKDRVYAEVSYVRLSADSTLIRTEIVNHTELVQNCLVNYFESIEYPSPSYCAVSLPEKRCMKDAREYDCYEYHTPRPWDRQNPDGMKKGEFADFRFYGGFGLGDRVGRWHLPRHYIPLFGAEQGDRVRYTMELPAAFHDAVLALRYRTSDVEYGDEVRFVNGSRHAVFTLNGTYTVDLAPADDPVFSYTDLGALPQGSFALDFVAAGTGAAEFDFLCIVERSELSAVTAAQTPFAFQPQIETKKEARGYLSRCEYPDADGAFYLRTFDDNTRFRRIATGALEDCMTARLSNADPTFDDVTESFTGAFSRKHSDDGFFFNTIVHTLFVQPGETAVVYAVLSEGETAYLTEADYETLYRERLAGDLAPGYNTAGKKYELSAQILKATTLTNAVYPIYKHGEYIIHHTPGKRWDCLYTWDSGFIGLGMLDFAPAFAAYSLETYLSDETNPDYAFLHHGSPVPVQFYLYLEMLKRTEDKTSLLALYPRLKLYYEFLAGRTHGSTTAKLKSGLTTTYDYFYSSGGMDDYPAQVAMMHREIRETTAPALTASQLIRCAKILRMIAQKNGNAADIAVFDADIARLTAALNTYAWDAETGYFSYVLHDDSLVPTGILRAENGENLNKGLDGIYPLIAGVCNDAQTQAILSHLKNPKEMLSPYGISAVDMRAGYFMVNGYWNGNVWFPHQWFIWKTMLDLGETDFAYQIAELALEVWKREVDYSYYTFEMVNVQTGRGGWFHNFGGLSTPVSMWGRAYFKAGTLNTGFDTWVERAAFTDDNTALTAEISYHGGKDGFAVIAVMNETCAYHVTLDGARIDCCARFPGALEIPLSLPDDKLHTLRVKSV